jgi:hypothetical protein
LRVYDASGSGEEVAVTLPASGWLPLGSGGYRFRGATTDPVQAITVKADQITIRGGREAWGYTLNEPSQGRIAVRLSLGGTLDWCAEAPAKQAGRPPSTLANDRQDKFVGAAKTPPPTACPVPPLG